MEWFSRITPLLPPDDLALLCKLPNLPRQCSSIYHIEEISADSRSARIECVWGVFAISLTPIRNGVRYALTNCPNALQWTITTYKGESLIHCTINQESPDPDFSESIREFMENFRMGLERWLREPASEALPVQ